MQKSIDHIAEGLSNITMASGISTTFNLFNGIGTFATEYYTYVGNFKDGLFNGHGILTYIIPQNGMKMIEGTFIKGVPHGKCKCIILTDANIELETECEFNNGNIYIKM